MRIPLYIDFKDKNVAVIGGGSVGTNRAKKFINAGANVTVYSDKFSDELIKLARDGRLNLVKADVSSLNFEEIIKKSHLIVVAISDKSYNEQILNLAKRYKTIVNLANDAEKTEVVVPFEGGIDGIRFAVTTEGRSGLVARDVRNIMQKTLEKNNELLKTLEAMAFVKNYMKSKNVPVNLRLKLYPVIYSDSTFRELVKNGNIYKIAEYIESLIKEYSKKINSSVEF